MALNDMVLSCPLLTGMYRDLLVEESGFALRETGPAMPAPKPILFLGRNQQHVCLLVDYPEDVHVPEKQLGFLTTMLQACRLNLADVAIVNLHRQSCPLGELKAQLQPAVLFIFGEGLLPGPENLPLFAPVLTDGINLIQACTLEKLDNSAGGKLLKSRLWLCLKQIFGV